MVTITAAGWSAVAASLAACSSLMMLLIQRRNFQEATRPEMVIDGWTRGNVASAGCVRDTLGFKSIRNVGKGIALNVDIGITNKELHSSGEAFLPTSYIAVIPSGGVENVNGQVTFRWRDVGDPKNDQHKYVRFDIRVSCTDTRDVRYTTTYQMYVTYGPHSNMLFCPEVAPGVSLSYRKTETASLRRLRMRDRWYRLRRLSEKPLPREPLAHLKSE